MSSLPVIGFRGLKTSGNELAYPPGSLLDATNCCILSKDILTIRRGQPIDYGDTFGTTGDIARAMTEYQTQVVVHYGASSGDPTKLAMAFPLLNTFTNLAGTWEAPDIDTMRMKFAQLSKNLHWTSSSGLGVLDGVATGAARTAGVAAPGDIWQAIGVTLLSGNPDAGWMPKNSQVAYRAVIGRKDKNDNVKLSAPSTPLIIINPADATLQIGNLSRTGTTVTAQLAVGHGFKAGDILALSPGEANFTAGNYTLTSVTSTTAIWTNAGAAVANTVIQTLSSGSKNVSLPIYLPHSRGIVAGDFVQLYRTDPSLTATANPGDECFLAYERTLTAAQVSAQTVTLVDTTPASYLRAGNPLYCNSNTGSAPGAPFQNVTPPLMDDVTVFDGRLWGSNTQGPHETVLRLIGVGSPNGIQSGDLIAVDTRVYDTTGAIYAAGNAVANINETVLSIANGVLNFYSLAGFINFVADSTPNNSLDSLSLRIQRRAITGDVFYVGSSRASCWQDPMPAVTAVTEGSSTRAADVVTITTATPHGLVTGASIMLAIANGTTADALFPVGIKTPITVTGASTFTYAEVGTNSATIPSGTYFIYETTLPSERLESQLRFTPPGQPEAWPLPNVVSGLPDGLEVSRIKALRGSLYVFFKRGPTYTVSGTYPYNVQKFDGTSSLVAPDSLVEHNGRLHCLTTQGVVAISESGVQVLSKDIEDTLREAMLSDVVMAATFGVSYESDRQYILALGEATPDGVDGWCTDAYVYQSDAGVFTGPWRANPVGWTCGQVLTNVTQWGGVELLSMGTIAYDALRYESKSYSYADDYDDIQSIGDGTDIENTGPGVFLGTGGVFDDIVLGDFLVVNGGGPIGHVTAIEDIAGDIQVTTDGTLDTDDFVYLGVWKAIPDVALEWLAATAGNPAVEKQWAEALVHADSFVVGPMQAVFTTERTQDTSAANRTLSVVDVGKGPTPADVARNLFTQRLEVHSNAQRAAMLRVKLTFKAAADGQTYAGTKFRLLGYSLNAEGGSTRTGHKTGVAP